MPARIPQMGDFSTVARAIGAGQSEGRAGWEKGAAREKTWKGSQGEVEALRRDPFRSFTGIDPSSKPGVTHPKESGPARSEGRAR